VCISFRCCLCSGLVLRAALPRKSRKDAQLPSSYPSSSRSKMASQRGNDHFGDEMNDYTEDTNENSTEYIPTLPQGKLQERHHDYQLLMKLVSYTMMDPLPLATGINHTEDTYASSTEYILAPPQSKLQERHHDYQLLMKFRLVHHDGLPTRGE
jgi:hypothetical protein